MEMDQKSRGRSLSLTPKFYHLVQLTDCERKTYSLAEITLLWGNPLQECSFHSEEGLPDYSAFCREVAKLLRKKFLLLVYTLSVL